MAAWTNGPDGPGTQATRRRPTASRAGILRPDELARHVAITRRDPAPALDRWVERHWSLRWSLPAGRAFASQTLPHPACNLTLERGATRPEVGDDPVVVTGVVTRRFDVLVRGRGSVDGVKFRPGGLAALTGLDAAALTDRTLPASGLVPGGLVTATAAIPHGADPGLAADRFEAALLPVAERLGPDPGYDTVLEVVADMLEDRTLLRVADLEARHGLSRRSLARLFARYVGVGPKWVLARYRMHDVVTALDAGHDGSLADLAADHGFYDQAHFTRDFTRLVGVPPGQYREEARRDGGPAPSTHTDTSQTRRAQ